MDSFKRTMTRWALYTAVAGILAPAAWGQSTGRTVTSSTDRLFLNFIEDATVVNNQWWEGQVELVDGEVVDATLLRGIVAFRPWMDIEVGGRVGFGETDAPGTIPDGTGATDLDAWAKYYFNNGDGNTEFAVGAIVTIPTGDDSEGLGNDAFAAGVFGAMRYRLGIGIATGKVGVRKNGDGRQFGSPEVDGEVSPSLGVGLIAPWTDRVSFVAEVNWEAKRFEGGDADTRVLGGINWRAAGRGIVRAAVAVGLTDGAPDTQLNAGYAYTF